MILLHNPIGLEDLIIWASGSILICYLLKKNYGWAASLAFGVTVFSALRICQLSFNGIPDNLVLRQMSYAADSALMSLLLTVMIAQTLSIESWVKIFKFVAISNGLAIFGHIIFAVTKSLVNHTPLNELLPNHIPTNELPSFEPWGILFNASMSGCLNAAIFPLFKAEEKYVRWFVAISVIATGRSLPIAVLFVGIGALLYTEKKYKQIAFALPLSLVVGFLVKGSSLFIPRGRDLIWKRALVFFHDHLPWLIGGGLGSFYAIGPTLTTKQDKVTFIWLHSDWLQTLFEQGFLGFNIILLMYLYALNRSRLNPKLFAGLAAYGAFGMANMPLRYPLAGLFGAILIRWALEDSHMTDTQVPQPSPPVKGTSVVFNRNDTP